MPYKTNWKPNDPGFDAWMNSMSADMNNKNEGMGWRNILSLATGSSATLAGLRINRVGPLVALAILDLRGNGAVGGAINFVSNLPVSLRPPGQIYLRPLGTRIVTVGNPVTSVTAIQDQLTVSSAGQIGCNADIDTSDTSWFMTTWLTSTAFPLPASYPGDAVVW